MIQIIAWQSTPGEKQKLNELDCTHEVKIKIAEKRKYKEYGNVHITLMRKTSLTQLEVNSKTSSVKQNMIPSVSGIPPRLISNS